MKFSHNVYNKLYPLDPDWTIYQDYEKMGVQKLIELEHGQSYEFDTFVVMYHPGLNELGWARDSGCSCPTPFESFKTFNDLNSLHAGTWEEFLADLKSFEATTDEMMEIDKIVKPIFKEITK